MHRAPRGDQYLPIEETIAVDYGDGYAPGLEVDATVVEVVDETGDVVGYAVLVPLEE